jgi:hypothetical protein
LISNKIPLQNQLKDLPATQIDHPVVCNVIRLLAAFQPNSFGGKFKLARRNLKSALPLISLYFDRLSSGLYSPDPNIGVYCLCCSFFTVYFIDRNQLFPGLFPGMSIELPLKYLEL